MANSGDKYQVFLNFCGPDTRRGFTNSLYHALVDAGIRVFIDDKELPPGERFDSNLLQAIHDSKLYITILSPKYASHHWCLRELAMMMENISKPEEDGNKKAILPIFYNVKPDDVKLKTDLYSKDISELEQKVEDQKKKFFFFGLDQKKKFGTEEVETWRHALKEVDAYQGWELEKYEGDGHLSKAVVEYVVNRLQIRQREVTKDLVGMDDRVADINNLLDIDSGGVRLIGIYGMGGIGKTTLVKIIYNQLCPYFGKNCSFLDNVRETAKTKGLVELQKQLLFDFSNSSDICNTDHGIKRIGDTIHNKKVLIVLDDVDDPNQIKKLIGVNSFNCGTTIFVTTRDKSVLKFKGFQFEGYEMEGLSNEDALQLFSRHAFDDNFPQAGYYNLSKELVSTAGGLPLALQAIGASLFNEKNEDIWKEMLKELHSKPHDDVLGKLKITYDALKQAQQNIFLDIACFFIDEEKTNPIFMWSDCGFLPNSAIDVLTKRCMIKVLDNNRFWMHDQFRDLGRAINEEAPTRLWDTTDIKKLWLIEEKKSVKALHFGCRWHDSPRLTVTREEIECFPNLQFLWMDDVSMQGDFVDCLSELKWFYLGRDVPADDDGAFMPTNLHLKNVVVLRTYGYEWTEDAVKSLIKEATKLKVLSIGSCRLIHETPTFYEHLVLEKLSFLSWSSLKKISCSIGKLKWLTDLDFGNCEALEKLPEQIGELKNLQRLSLEYCESLREVPDSVSKLESLTKLDLYSCRMIQKLPELPKSLSTLRLASTSLQSVPNISNFTNLVELRLSEFFGCHSNITQPCDLSCIEKLFKLRKLQLCLSNVRATSIEWGSLSLLEELRLHRLDLQTLKQLPSSLRVLQLSRTQVERVELDGLPNLEELNIESCKRVTRISVASSLNNLRNIRVNFCLELVELQFHGVLKSMESLYIDQNESLERLVCLSEEELGCNELQAPELTGGRRRVYTISSSLKMLRDLTLSHCHKPQEIQFVSPLEALEKFKVSRCILLERLGGLSNLKNLNILSIWTCEKLQVVDGIDKLERLEKLTILCCRSVERIFESSSSKLPKECQISIVDCKRLLNTGPLSSGIAINLDNSSITWECYREMILNAQTQAADSTIETTFPETGDPLLAQQDDGDDDDDNEVYCREDDDDEYDEDDCSDEDDEDDEHEDHENADSEDDEVDDVHSSHLPLPDSSMDNHDEDDDVDKEFEGEANSNSNTNDNEDEDDDNDEDKNEHEVLQSSRGLLPGCSVGDIDENNEVKEEGKGDSDSDEDRMRTRKRKRGTMQKPKRNTMTVMTTTATAMSMTRKTMVMKTTTGATTMAKTTPSPWMTLCRSICSCLAGLCGFFSVDSNDEVEGERRRRMRWQRQGRGRER